MSRAAVRILAPCATDLAGAPTPAFSSQEGSEEGAMALRYTKHYNLKQTPQSEPIPNSGQVRNSAGGYAYPTDDWLRLRRFLILGSEGGSYYASERNLTRENADAVLRCIQADGLRVVRESAEISDSGRAPKNDPAIFVLAMCAGLGEAETRAAALQALPRVCRIGTHLFHFAEYADGFRGWGRGLRNAIADWYDGKSVEALAYQAVKYQQRDGWSHRDLLRKAHPKTGDPARNALYRWIVDGGPVDESDSLRIVEGFERAKRATAPGEIAALIREYDLPRECVPTSFLTEASVWDALLEKIPMTAMIRNLATMTRAGLIAPGSQATGKVIQELRNPERIRKSRVHPIALLSALKTYAQGHGERSDSTWEPVQRIVDALDEAFYAAFQNVNPTHRRLLIALDVSGSMSEGRIAGVPGLTPRDASAALALVTAATEPNHDFIGFSTELIPLRISPKRRLDDAVKTISDLPYGGTDCALPMLHALEKKQEFDAFVVITDNETWHGKIHPTQALERYRQKTGIPAKLIVVGMTASGFTIADPNDGGMLDVVGFDTATPQLMAEFIRGEI
jgi:60 kDa SS-A/Ro ribonucleoprotein